MKIYDIEIEAQQNFMDTISWLFNKLIHEFGESPLSFSKIIEKYHRNITRSIPDNLKKSLSDYYGVKNFFGGGYYPKKYSAVKIINNLKHLLNQFLEENLFTLESSEVKLWASGVLYDIYSKSDDDNDFNQSLLLNEMQEDIRLIILKNFTKFTKNINRETLLKENIKKVSKKELSSHETQKIWKNILENIKSNFKHFVKNTFWNLSIVDKKLLIFIIWFYFPRFKEKPYESEYEYTNEKLSASDTDMLLDIMANQYLEIYETCNVDFLHFFK